MSPKLQRFVDEYMVDMIAKQAAIRAGYSARTAEQQGSRLLSNAKVAAAIGAAMERRQKRTEVTADRVLTEAWALLTADPRELVELRIDCCRHCYGLDHRHQRTRGEMERDRAAHALAAADGRAKGKVFDEQGGIGFDPRKPPMKDCPECFGRGVEKVLFNDTRSLSAAAASLYAGVKQTRDGMEVKLHPKVDAIEKLCRHLGLYDRARPGSDTLARLAGAKTLADKGQIVFEAVAAGDLTVGQASQLLTGLGTLASLIETDELSRRVAALETTHEGEQP